jgi:hypothetical protein
VSLSGNLGFVSLDEVLRLLTRSKQRGAVDVKGEKVRGRIFVDRGGVGLATTFSDQSLHRHLLKSGLIESSQLDTIVAGTTDMGKATDGDGGAMTALLREMSVESIYQLGLNGETFEVYENESSPYANTKPFELEDLLSDSKQRLSDWAEVTTIVSDLDRHLRFRRDLGERDHVTIAKESWRLLSEVGEGKSVRSLADELGTTEFWTARVAAGLIEDELLGMEAEAPRVVEEAPAWEYSQPQPVAAEPMAAEPITAETVVQSAQDAGEVDPNQSWWTEPAEEETSTDDALVAAAAEQTEDAAASASTPQDQPAAESTEVAEDTEAFLEKVFADMEPTEEADEGYGLLRRRRMGVLRDTAGDS